MLPARQLQRGVSTSSLSASFASTHSSRYPLGSIRPSLHATVRSSCSNLPSVATFTSPRVKGFTQPIPIYQQIQQGRVSCTPSGLNTPSLSSAAPDGHSGGPADTSGHQPELGSTECSTWPLAAASPGPASDTTHAATPRTAGTPSGHINDRPADTPTPAAPPLIVAPAVPGSAQLKAYSSSGTDHPSLSGAPPATSSSSNSRSNEGALLPCTQQPSRPEQQQHLTSVMPVAALSLCSALAVGAGALALSGPANHTGGHLLAAASSMNISLEVIPPRFLAAATLVLTLVVTAFTAGALALWCRWRSTTLAAFLKLDGRLDWRAVWQGLATGAVGLCLCDIVQLLCKLVLRSAVPQPPICSAVQQLDVLTYLLHSGDPLAVAMSFSTMVFAAPICEELIFRGIALQCLVDLYPKLAPVMVLVTSLGFAAVHGGLSFPKQVSVAVIGMWWGLSYLAAGRNLLVPITAHAYQNLMNLLKWLV